MSRIRIKIYKQVVGVKRNKVTQVKYKFNYKD